MNRLLIFLALALSALASPPQQMLLAVTPATSGYDADAQAYFNAIVANSGTISTASKGYVNTFILAAKSHGYFTKLVCFNMLVGDQLAAAQVQYNGNASTSSVATNHNFVGGDYTEAGGLVGNGSTKYLDTGYNPTALTNTNAGMWSYLVAGGQYIMGNLQGSFVGAFEVEGSASANIGGHITDTVAYSFSNYTKGMVGVTTDGASSSTVKVYSNGSDVTAGTGLADASFTSNNIYVFALNLQGTGPFGYNSCTQRFYAVSTGLTSTQASNFYSDVLAFETSLSRN